MFVKVHRRCDNGDIWFDDDCFVCAVQNMNLHTSEHLFTELYLRAGNGFIMHEIRETPEYVVNSLCTFDI